MKANMIILAIFVLFITGCNTEQNNIDDMKIVKTKTGQEDLALQPAANDAKEKARNKKQVKKVKAVELNRDLFVVIEPKHQYTFQTNKITKDLKEEIEKEWPEKEVRVTTDHKFYLELEKLEERIKQNKITKNQLNKELDKLKKLLDEQI